MEMEEKPENINFIWRDEKGKEYDKFYECETDHGIQKNILGNIELLLEGEYYWEIKIIKANHLKIGIVGKNNCYSEKWEKTKNPYLSPLIKNNELKKSFSNYEDGYSLYNNGEIRNNNNIKGKKVIRNLINGDIVGVHLKNNFLGYWINNEFIGWIFKINSQNNNIFIPAVSLLLEGEKIEFL